MDAPFSLPYKCSADGSEWIASLLPRGNKFAFASFAKPAVAADHSRSALPVQRQDFQRRLQELLSTVPALEPGGSAELVGRTRSRRLQDADITDFGFECPACKHSSVFICPDCHKHFCGNVSRDGIGRFLCSWCSATLIFTASPRDPIEVEGTTPDIEIRYRLLSTRQDESTGV